LAARSRGNEIMSGILEKIPLATWLMAGGMLVAGVIAWADLQNASAMNAKTNEQQEEELELIKRKSGEAAVQRGRIEEQLKNTNKLLERLERKLDN
jgi:hypothetical protein